MNLKKISLLYFVLLFCVLPTLRAQTAYIDTTFTQYFRRTSGFTAGDATISLPLPDGRVLWFFGDSYIDNYDINTNTLPCLFQVRNCFVVQDCNDLNQMQTYIDYTQTGSNRTYFRLTQPNNVVLWPGNGYVQNDTANVFLFAYNTNNYAYENTYIARIAIAPPTIVGNAVLCDNGNQQYTVPYLPNKNYTWQVTNGIIVSGQNTNNIEIQWINNAIEATVSLQQSPEFTLVGIYKLPYFNGAEFGKAVLVDTINNYLYMFGTQLNWIVREPVLARCQLNNPLNTFEFFSQGNQWLPTANNLKKLSPEPVSPSYSVIYLQNKFFIITQENGYLECGLGREIYAYQSNDITGTYTNKKLLYTIEDQLNGNYLLTYNTEAHPHFIQNNELLISYNVNDRVDTIAPYTCPSQCKNVWIDRFNADLYRPKFVRVPFNLMGL